MTVAHSIRRLDLEPEDSAAKREGLLAMWAGYVRDGDRVVHVSVTVAKALPGIRIPADGKIYAYGALAKSGMDSGPRIAQWRVAIPDGFNPRDERDCNSALWSCLLGLPLDGNGHEWAKSLKEVAGEFRPQRKPVELPERHLALRSERPEIVTPFAKVVFSHRRTFVHEVTGESVALFELLGQDPNGVIIHMGMYLLTYRWGGQETAQLYYDGDEAEEVYARRVRTLKAMREGEALP